MIQPVESYRRTWCLLLALCAALLLFSATLLDELRFAREAKRVKAVVTHIEVKNKGRRFTFILSDGSGIQADYGMASEFWLPRVGEPIALLVDEEQPARVRADTFWGRHDLTLTLLMACGLLGAGLALCAAITWHQRTKARIARKS